MRINRMISPPPANSSDMRAYMAAILEVTGMMSRQGFELRKMLGHLDTHLKPKQGFPHATLVQEASGLVRVTDEGHRYFSSRLSGTPIVAGQHVLRSHVVRMIRCLLAEDPLEGWEQVEARLEEEVD